MDNLKQRLMNVLTERTHQVAALQHYIQTGKFADEETILKWLSENSRLIGDGTYSRTYAANGNWVIKLTKNAHNDNYYNFAALVSHERLWERNPLFPVIRFVRILPDGTGIAIIEKLSTSAPPQQKIWNVPSLYLRLHRAYTSASYEFKTKDGTRGKETSVENWETLITLGVPMHLMQEMFDVIRQCGDFDIHKNNVGWRADGQVVIFDPVKHDEHSWSNEF